MTDETMSVRDGSGEMFDRIAERYDLVNRVLSLGIDQRWRKATVAALALRAGDRVLDLATGTGDLAFLLAKSEPGCTVVGLDPSAGMLAVARQKSGQQQLDARVQFLQGDAQELPFEAKSFSHATMAFGIRNVPDRPKALRELARVVRPGGRIAILELAEPRGMLGPLARFHVHTLVPRLGALLSGAHEYRYLQRSIAAFPAAEVFAKVLEDSGLRTLEVRPMTFGVVTLYVAEPR